MRKWLLTLLLVLVAAFAYKENESAFDNVSEDMMEFLAPTPVRSKDRQPVPSVNETLNTTPEELRAAASITAAKREAVQAATNSEAIDEAVIENTPEPWKSNDQIKGVGRVTRILADDNQGSRHQRFILTLPSGHTLLVAHNIDLAPRINSLRAGDTIEFYGEYIWNDKGGILHWTHHDPKGSHPGGWLKHNNELYQ